MKAGLFFLCMPDSSLVELVLLRHGIARFGLTADLADRPTTPFPGGCGRIAVRLFDLTPSSSDPRFPRRPPTTRARSGRNPKMG